MSIVMLISKNTFFYICIALLVGCATTPPVKFKELHSTAILQEKSPENPDKHISFYYTSDIDPKNYMSVMIDHVVVYKGEDQQFGNLSEEYRLSLADYAQKQFSDTLKMNNLLTNEAGEKVLRARITLLGVEKNTAVLSPTMKILPIGLLINAAKSTQSAQGIFGGSVTYAVEMYDSVSARLLRAYIAKEYPVAIDITKSFGALDAAKAGVRQAAYHFVQQLKPEQ